jgi:CheY-like chemotaxis protein
MNQEVQTINEGRVTKKATAPFIFLAEDDIDDQELFAEAISLHNNAIRIQSVTNGKRAIEFLETLPVSGLPCLIVLDYNLPEADGAQILKFLSQQERFDNVPKVVWSTSNSYIYREACLRLGARAYFAKPTDVSGISILAKEMLTFCEIEKH